MNERTPYIGFSNATLNKLPTAKDGDMVACKRCKGEHALEGGMVGGKKSEFALFYKCGVDSYLGGVNGRLVVDQPFDVTGEI